MDVGRRGRGEAAGSGFLSRLSSRPGAGVGSSGQGSGRRSGLLLLALVQFVVIMFLITHPHLQNPFVSPGFVSFSGSGSGSGSGSSSDSTMASLSLQVSELQAQLLAVSELKTAYRKQWGACTCKYTNKGPRGGYCVSREVRHDNEILSVELADELISLFNSSCDAASAPSSCRPSVWDFGCGVGQYGKYMAEHAPNIQWQGFDGAEGVEDKTDGRVKFLDLTEPAYLSARDWSMSLEVGEHIPAEFEDIFIDNLHRHNTKGIVLSWGIPGQPGSNHINLHPNEYVISKMTKRGYRYDKQQSMNIRQRVPITWFKNTIMVFHREKLQL